MAQKEILLNSLRLGKLVHGGQCIATIADESKFNGYKVFVWGGLPDELVDVRIVKKKRSYMEGVVTEVHEKSPHRIEPREPGTYLSTSPWQIMTFDAENAAKQAILQEAFEREGVEGISWQPFVSGELEYEYRNKVEFGFWGDDDGLHYAHYVRGTHGKKIITENALARPEINQTAAVFIQSLREFCKKKDIRAGDLKTVLFRCSQAGEVVAALFMKKEVDFSGFWPPEGLKGLDVYYSNPKSPASVPTKKLYSFGDITLTDSVLGKNIIYDVLSFFQVNVPVFETALNAIKEKTTGQQVVDLYSGVGTIGVALGATTLVESEETNVIMAKKNVKGSSVEVVHATSEHALKHIDGKSTVIVDPPRAGMHRDLIDHLAEIRSPQVVYLSCNPSTQARDVKLLSESYKVTYAQGYNFFPRTPHIESLIVLERV
jgi:23S rRNA (uracil1939-C5)-methyltransferase